MLRDGASARYGSDAIVGAINFQLKDARSGGSLQFRTGRFLDLSSGDQSTCGPIGTSCNGIGGHCGTYTSQATSDCRWVRLCLQT